MQSRTLACRVLATVLLAGVLVPALAQGGEDTPKPSFTSLINVDALIENHCRFLARKYNLSEEQDAFTQEFLRKKADQFLSRYQDELFSIADRMFEVRGGGEMSQEELLMWGERALPLYYEAKQIIVEGNDEWRQVLTEEQKRIHDEDLALMYDSFAATEEHLDRIIAGEMTVDEFRRGPRTPKRSPGTSRRREMEPREATPAPVVDGQPQRETRDRPPAERSPRTGRDRAMPEESQGEAPSRTSRRAEGREDRSDPRRIRATPRGKSSDAKGFESEWEKYTKDFIERYKLDEAQTQKAMTILEDCLVVGRNYAKRRESQIKMLDEKAQKLSGEKGSADQLKRINEEREKIMKPLSDVFERQLKPRLDRLPTRAQRDAAGPAGSSKRDDKPMPRPRPRDRDPEEEGEGQDEDHR